MSNSKDWHFLVQFLFSSVVISLCVFKLTVGDRNTKQNNDALYWGGLLGIVGAWLPTPSGKSSNSEVTSAYVNKQTNVLSESSESGKDEPS